jgi:hypothetical protein
MPKPPKNHSVRSANLLEIRENCGILISSKVNSIGFAE